MADSLLFMSEWPFVRVQALLLSKERKACMYDTYIAQELNKACKACVKVLDCQSLPCMLIISTVVYALHNVFNTPISSSLFRP